MRVSVEEVFERKRVTIVNRIDALMENSSR